MDQWVAVVLAIVLPVITIGALGFVLIMANKTTTVFERDINGNIVAIVNR